MSLETVERRVRNLEIRALAAERVVGMLAFFVAMEIKSGAHLTKLGDTLKTAGHSSLTDPDEQKLFMEHTSHAAMILSAFGDSIQAIVPEGSGKALTKDEVRKMVKDILPEFHLETLIIPTDTEPS